VLIVGYHGDAVRDWFAKERPDLDITYVEQERRLGLGHAVWTAREAVGDQAFFCVLGDTILKADYGALLSCPENMIGVRQVEDPRRFGVVIKEGERVTGFVEKPADPPSNLAIVGAYLFHEGGALFEALGRLVAEDRRTRGEYQLTDALQIMLEDERSFRTVEVTDWYDCGKRETWLQTNRVLLDRGAGEDGASYVHPSAEVRDSRLGPHVSLGPGCVVEACEIRDAVIGAGSVLRHCRLDESLVGEQCRLEGIVGSVNIGDFCELSAKEQG
jgi:glucose-1-phosphate thymidylyltransferase